MKAGERERKKRESDRLIERESWRGRVGEREWERERESVRERAVERERTSGR